MAGLWISEAKAELIVAPLQFDLNTPEATAVFGQPTPVALAFDSPPETIGRQTKEALLAFTGAAFDWAAVIGKNYPPLRASKARTMSEFVSRHRGLMVKTRGLRLQVETDLLDDSDESITLRGELWVASADAELGTLILRVFRTAQEVRRAGLP